MLSQEKIDQIVDQVADFAKTSIGSLVNGEVIKEKKLPEKIKGKVIYVKENVSPKKDKVVIEEEPRRKVMFNKNKNVEPVSQKNKFDMKDVFQLVILLVPVLRLSKKMLNGRKMK
ncbi:hypothetical protein P7G31_08670 [Streptococcus parauberis]|uniref:Uncharacterized protein n=1 Tax=Streptococcus parauberis TaxID=1348 RepID=A0AAE4KZR5_9STRE|nr:hypothetical protein [Streptococcus parauberis]MDT2732297.1 hypothetical protein [Streptococcus parauberis]